MSITDENLRRAESIGEKHVIALFDCRVHSGAYSLDAQLATGRFSPDIERAKAPFQGLERREGMMIQEAVASALRTLTTLEVVTNDRVVITESDRKLVAANRHRDLGDINAPRAGDAVGHAEIDVWTFDAQSRRMRIVDVKRAPRPRDTDLRALKEAALSRKRHHHREGRHYDDVDLVVLRWFAEPVAMNGASYATRETIDGLFDAPICAYVDAAWRCFREGVKLRMPDHIATSFGWAANNEQARRHGARPNLLETARLATVSFLNGRRA